MNTPSILAASVFVLGAAPTLAIAAGAQGQHVTEAGWRSTGVRCQPDEQAAAPAAMPMGAMDHGDMNMQGGSAPADARDPMPTGRLHPGQRKIRPGRAASASPRR